MTMISRIVAGLAGLIELQHSGVMQPGETAAILFSGVER